MHELSLSGAVVDTVVRHADGRKVTAVELTVGVLRQVVPRSLEFYFEITARGTVCEGARLEQHQVEAQLSCRACPAAQWTLDQPIFRCPQCGGSDLVVLSGEEFFVESIDVHFDADASEHGEEEQACTVPG